MVNFTKYLGFRLRVLHPFAARARRRRMLTMLSLSNVTPGASVLDLGGTSTFWNYSFLPRLNITVLNLPGEVEGPDEREVQHHLFRFIQGDACNVTGIQDDSFDLAFSNSVIEHVGGPERRAQFAAEVRRLGKAYWVQTPSIWFPIEAHTGMLFWWFCPAALRRHRIKRWRKKLPVWADMIEGTTIVTRGELQRLFPEGTIHVERFLGLPKSYVVFSRKDRRSAIAPPGRG